MREEGGEAWEAEEARKAAEEAAKKAAKEAERKRAEEARRVAEEAAKKAAEEARKAKEEADRKVSEEAAAALAAQTAIQAGGAVTGVAAPTGTEDAEVRRWANALKNLELMKSIHGGPKSKGPKAKPSAEAGTSKGPGTAEGGTKVPRTQEVSPLFLYFILFCIDQCIAQRKRASGSQCR